MYTSSVRQGRKLLTSEEIFTIFFLALHEPIKGNNFVKDSAVTYSSLLFLSLLEILLTAAFNMP